VSDGPALGDRLEQAIERHADLEAEIEREEAAPPPRARLRRAAFWLAVTGVSLYLVFPSVVEVFGSWRNIRQLAPGWLALMAALQVAVLGCLWGLQRVAIHLRRWRPVITSQLAGNALSKVAPGGGAMGAALQYRMLLQAGVAPAQAASGLTAANLLVFGFVLGLPVLAVPALVRGGVNRDLLEAAVLALVLLAFCGAQVLGQIPVTPGGLGFVEAGLTAMLTLAGVSAGDAVLATFAYRLFSYWLQLPFGLLGLALHRRSP